MCKYCEMDYVGNVSKKPLRNRKSLKVQIVTNAFNENLYYLNILPERASSESISINYCPMCGKRLGGENEI